MELAQDLLKMDGSTLSMAHVLCSEHKSYGGGLVIAAAGVG